MSMFMSLDNRYPANTLLLGQNDAASSLWSDNNVIIAPWVYLGNEDRPFDHRRLGILWDFLVGSMSYPRQSQGTRYVGDFCCVQVDWIAGWSLCTERP